MKSVLAVLSLSLVFGMSAKAAEPESNNEPASGSELKIINQFSDHLFDLIQRKNVQGYTALVQKSRHPSPRIISTLGKTLLLYHVRL